MFSAYLFCLMVGGFFVVISAFGGHHDEGDAVGDGHLHLDAASDHGHQLQLDMQSDLAHLPVAGHQGPEDAGDHDHPPATTTDHAPLGASVGWLLLSFRFWTYAACFFGLTGVLLATLTTTGPIVTGLLATGAGLGCGVTASVVLRAMRAHSSSSDVTLDDLLGATGKLEFPLAPGRTGKVRIERRGHIHDLLARSGEREALGADVPVVVVGFENDEAIVVHAGRLLGGPGGDSNREGET